MRLKSVKFNRFYNQRATQQINGREGETATFFSRCLFTLDLRGGGFAPRHLNRYAFFSLLQLLGGTRNANSQKRHPC